MQAYGDRVIESPSMAQVPRERAQVGFGTLLKRFLVGRAHPSQRLGHAHLPKALALPILSSDALSSVAYATEQILVVLLVASVGSQHKALPIAGAIAVLMLVVVASYAQICRAYPMGGGGYMVSKDNLGAGPSLVAAAALLVDLVLTVAVSVVAGVVAIISFAPSLLPHAVQLSVLFVTLITVANLRGLRESGALFALPTYAFIVAIFLTVGTGLSQCLFSGCPQAEPVPPLPGLAGEAEVLGLFVILHAFSSGATALTGVEAIATAVPVFRRPQSKNAQTTLLVMGAIAIAMFMGISYLATHAGVTVSAHRSVVAQIAHATFHGGPVFYLVQVFTTAILVLAANTSFQAFPRLLAILARDRFVPRRFANMGDRLVFSNGVVFLAVAASLLIWAFQANLDRLIQLYVVGVFTDFTLSQVGMVKRWIRFGRQAGAGAERWRRRLVVNSIGAVATGTVLAITIATKFVHGAWIVVAAIPAIVAVLAGIRRHYDHVALYLRRDHVPARANVQNHVVMLVPDLGPATAEALGYVRSFRPVDLRAVYLGVQAGIPQGLPEQWREFSRGGPALEELPSGNGDLTERVRRLVRETQRGDDDVVTVVLPELIDRASLRYLVRRVDLIRLKAGLLREPGVVVTDVPVVTEGGLPRGIDGRPLVPSRTVALVLVSGVHDATARAVIYARSLQAAETRAIFFALDPEGSEGIERKWADRGFDIPLDVVEAPFRDLTSPVLEEVRRFSVREDTVVSVVLPELLVRRWWHFPLHNQNALFIKRLLLFEPRVILSSVPYRLE
jgi:amino acid transporter